VQTADYSAEYGGPAGVNVQLQLSILNFNSPPPDPKATTIQSRRPYPQFGRIRMWDDSGNSNYHSLQARFEHRLSHGLSLTSAYTWSHLIDDEGAGLNANRALSQNPNCLRCNMRGNSQDDQRHSFVAAYVWHIHFASGLKGVARAVFNGWRYGGPIDLAQRMSHLHLAIRR